MSADESTSRPIDMQACDTARPLHTGHPPPVQTLRERDAQVIANIGRLRFSPLSLIGGRGNRLIEEGGRELLDLSASFGPAILGYSHPAIAAAVNAATASMAGASLLAFPNENAVALAERAARDHTG